MPAYCAARSCETRPWVYQSIAAARCISCANASGDSAIGARASLGNSIRMACSVFLKAHASFPSSAEVRRDCDSFPILPAMPAGREGEAVFRRGPRTGTS